MQETIEYALTKKGAEYELKAEWDDTAMIKIGGKMFLLDGGEECVDLKCELELAQVLRKQADNMGVKAVLSIM